MEVVDGLDVRDAEDLGADVVQIEPDGGALQQHLGGVSEQVRVRGRMRTPMSREPMASARVQPVVAMLVVRAPASRVMAMRVATTTVEASQSTVVL